jgi:hypothetical protein
MLDFDNETSYSNIKRQGIWKALQRENVKKDMVTADKKS